MENKIDFNLYLPTQEDMEALKKSCQEAKKELDGIYQDYLADRNVKRFKSRILTFEKESDKLRKRNRKIK